MLSFGIFGIDNAGAGAGAGAGDLSPVVHVAFVAKDHLLHICAGVLLNVPYPVLYVVEALLIGDVIHQHDAHCTPG